MVATAAGYKLSTSTNPEFILYAAMMSRKMFETIGDTSAHLATPLDLTARMAVLLVAHSPDGLVAVFADKQATVLGDRDSDGATPDFAFRRNKTGHEILIFAARFAG
jgi:hypothetical protein